MSKQLTTINAQLTNIQEAKESDLSDSDDEDGSQHFQTGSIVGRRAVQFAQVETAAFEAPIERLFKQSRKLHPKDLDLCEVILLDSQSTIDLFCNPELVEKIWETQETLNLSSNGSKMSVKMKCRLLGYNQSS